MNGPHFEIDDDFPVAPNWAVPLDEPAPPAAATAPAEDQPVLPFSFLEPDAPPADEGFHPRLKRFDEAA